MVHSNSQRWLTNSFIKTGEYLKGVKFCVKDILIGCEFEVQKEEGNEPKS